ncbi:hypothetical protein PZB74_02255 [Porifericola rhodea]|uniref:hypothetical protein n=1 Tax=Porifericola rhodea TaxID=930972 RepID=UPI002666427B|nr:hypothetical protein [Porifericola rhodea]WKN32176.1 hypothetical protein PZB74_02255 [Porifericola rhodea]
MKDLYLFCLLLLPAVSGVVAQSHEELIEQVGVLKEEASNFRYNFNASSKTIDGLAWQAHMLKTLLLIYINTNDEDIPDGYAFDRINTKTAQEIRLKMYKFLANVRFKKLKELQ